MAIPKISRLNFRADVNSKEFQASCISVSNEIDAAIGNNVIPANVKDLAMFLNHACRRRCNDQTKAVLMVLMISVKNACQLGWFPQRETRELLALVDSMWKGFGSPENVPSSLNSPVSLIPQVMERFYPFFNLGHILVSFEAEPKSNRVVKKDFHISKKMLQDSPKQRLGLFVFQTEDISKSSCLIHPQEVSFVLNGKGVEKRGHISMESGPQCPTDVTTLLNSGANLLLTIGCFGGSYFIVIAFLDVISLPNNLFLKDYVHSEVIESNSDCDIIVGPSRISLSCPISLTRIKLPVKGHLCKHLQCFDFWNYVKINLRIPSWRCPLCNQPVCYTDIRVDQNMRKILEEVGRNATDVVISADGSWRVGKENDGNVEAVPETTHEHGDPNSFLDMRLTVLDRMRDENETDTSGGTQINEQDPRLSEIRGPSASNNTHKPATDYRMLDQPSASINAQPQFPPTLNVLDGQQQFMNAPQILNTRNSAARQALPMTYIPTSSQQDRLATNTASYPVSTPAAQSSQFQGSHVIPLGLCQGRTSDLMDRWRHIYRNGTSQTQSPPMPPPTLQHHNAMHDQRLPIRSVAPVQEIPMPSSSSTHPQTSAVNDGGTSDQRPKQKHLQRTENGRPLTRMRGSLMPGSTRYDNMIIRPTQPVEEQAQTVVPAPQPTVYNNIASYPNSISETQDRMGSMPVDEDIGASGLFWSMPPEAW